MKVAISLAIAVALLTSIPLLAQQAGASANAQEMTSGSAAGTQVGDSAHARASANASPSGVAANGSANDSSAASARVPAKFGDEAASHAWEMSSISGELEGKLDSKTAKAGDRVVLKTTEKVQTSDGTIIPRGSRLIGHVTEAQAYSKEHGAAQLGIAFDRVEMKNGQSSEIYTLIRGMKPSAAAIAANSMGSDDMMGPPMGEGAAMAGGPAMGGGRGGGGLVGGAGGALNGAGNMAGGAIGRTGQAATGIDDRVGSGLGSTESAAVQTAGHGDLTNLDTNVHAAAAARAVPHLTGVPGVMLSGNSTASGLLLAPKNNIDLQSGTQMQLGIVAK